MAPSNKPPGSKFYQQNLKAWQPILTPKAVIATFIVVAFIFFPIGIILKGASDSVVEYSYQYDGSGAEESCKITSVNEGKNCQISITVDEEMEQPIYVYYELHNFYQNHRRYVKSRSDEQLNGELKLSTGSLEECKPLITKVDPTDNVEKILHPCGLIANSYFNDKISLVNADFQMDETDISWKSDRDEKFKAISSVVKDKHRDEVLFIDDLYPELSSVEDEHFIVWMRTAALPNFRKLYGRIEKDIPAGTTIKFDLTANFQVSSFDGKKFLVMSTTSWLGGKNPFLGYTYMFVAVVCAGLAAAFFIKQKVSGRELGDTRYLVWKNRA
eukprot:TRINITY_DN6561_c0_g1_i1.p1 TRINITY_DN6561_c0_g1~~TRINITY_DN6561_c0_g1_i1.p1  ORF type:complete len:328 (+),score=55.52 TRINITY_DN6561_c0_g1_i1:76-1059(+)